MGTFFHKTFAVAEKKTLTVDEVAERIAGAFEHPFVAARTYVREVGVEWISALLTSRGRKSVDKYRRVPYRWESGITCSDAAKVFFVALYRPGYLDLDHITKSLGPELAQVVVERSRDIETEDLIEILGLPTAASLYKIASVLRTDTRYADLPRKREWSPTEQQAQQIKRMLETRRPYTEIAKMAGVSINTIREHIRQNGLCEPSRRGRRTDHSRNDAIIAEFNAGLSATDLSEKWGLTKARIYQIVGTGAETPADFKKRVKNLFSTCPNMPEKVRHAVQTLREWAEEE